MTDREKELRDLVASVRDRECVDDVFLAKCFTDRHLVVDTRANAAVPEDLQDRFREYGLRDAAEVYGTDHAEAAFPDAGAERTRHHFVDVGARGTLQSYVVTD